MDTENTSLCRICLEGGATFPIFENRCNQESIYSKLLICTKEKVEDIEGYPKNICSMCIETLDTVCNFIKKYKESSKILESGIFVIKNENIDYDQYSDNDPKENYSEVEIEIKAETNDIDEIDDNECLAQLIKPLNIKKIKTGIKKEIDKIKLNKEITIKKIKLESKNKTNKVASSLLEGEFTWTGDKCLKTSKTKDIPKNKTKLNEKPKRKEKRRKEIQIPKIKKSDPQKLCDLCGEVFKTQDKLSIHKRKVHFKNPVQCPKCPRMCASEYYLNRHMLRKHENKRDFICAICGKGFAFKGELTTHNRSVHDKIRPKRTYSCKFCDKTYKCAKSIVVHERSVHTGQRPAECDICGSTFYHIDYLREHMRLHTGETPFKCPICGRGYAQRCNMKSHLRIHRLAEIDPVTLSKIRPNYLKLLKDFR